VREKPPYPAEIGQTLAAVSTAQAAIFLINSLLRWQQRFSLKHHAHLVGIGLPVTANSGGCATIRMIPAQSSEAWVNCSSNACFCLRRFEC
jgi:hypothetical protein